ncbi:hypothetical protein GF319_02155 [Candidatus Bathyarchaeota archaeon]|nr:hypothetical protein [Candidatus Bathyarchaeota archaeon]
MSRINGETLEEISFRNTVNFYRKELIELNEGGKATEIFKDRRRKSFVKAGILKREYGHGGCRLKLSKRTKQILKNS